MTADEIREKFLKFFEGKQHKVVASDSLIPQNDPSLLFTGAGMNQFKDYFLGIKKDMKRAASSQKCLRTGDLDNVGKTPYHHSFFEMLGNFSFGDYFKKEAIAWAWEFLTQEMKISKDRLRVSVHEKDDEACEVWKNEIKVRPDWIVKLGDKGNFWPSNAPKDGPNGPCGPCSEIYFDQGENVGCGKKHCNVDCDCGRFAEIWNLVFTQYDRRDGGVLKPLAAKNIDTGMGLERLACVMQGKRTNYEIDTLAKLAGEVKKILKLKDPVPNEKIGSIYAIVDHARAVVFAIHDGAIPSNEGRGYVIRKLIRRAVWHGRQLGAHKAFLYELVGPVIEVMKKSYPELAQAEKNIVLTIRSEEERFLATIEQGTGILEEMIEKTKHHKSKTLSGEDMFKLYDTYGFPDELTQLIVARHGLHVDKDGFAKLMDAQRERSKQKSEITDEIFVVSDFMKKLAQIPKTKFLGYETLKAAGKVLYLDHIEDKYMVILDQSPFYGEGGGQVGDRGIFESAKFRGVVFDTQKEEDRILHYVAIEKGTLQAGDTVSAEVDREKRDATKRNHTATHILQAVLRSQLGAHVRQLGSLVNEDKLRFDFSHPKALTTDEIKSAEKTVNEFVHSKIRVCPEEKSLEEARKEGALAFFGDKYGERVRLLRIGDISLEFCGGTHCSNTADIQAFMITKETSVGAGVRRIEAITGKEAISNYKKQLEEISQEQARKAEAKKKELETRKITALSDDQIASMKVNWKGVNLVPRWCDDYYRTPQELRVEAEKMIKLMGENSVVVVISSDEEKVNIVVELTNDLVKKNFNAKNILSKIVQQFDGSGGGKDNFAQGGGKHPEKIKTVLEELPKILG